MGVKALTQKRLTHSGLSLSIFFLKASKTPRFLSEVAYSYQLRAIVSSEAPILTAIHLGTTVWSGVKAGVSQGT